jgi:hypothetical protein
MNIHLYNPLADQYQCDWYVFTNILKDNNAIVFNVKQSIALLGLLDLKMNGLWSLKMLLSIYQSMVYNPENLNLNSNTTFVVVPLK